MSFLERCSCRYTSKTAPSIPGWDLLYEHVHMNFVGNHAVASALLEQVGRILPETIRKSVEEGKRKYQETLARHAHGESLN